jgi:hypothetical protein
MMLPTVLTLMVAAGIATALTYPKKPRTYLDGLKDAEDMVQSIGLVRAYALYHKTAPVSTDYYIGYSDYIYSLQARLADLDYMARRCYSDATRS